MKNVHTFDEFVNESELNESELNEYSESVDDKELQKTRRDAWMKSHKEKTTYYIVGTKDKSKRGFGAPWRLEKKLIKGLSYQAYKNGKHLWNHSDESVNEETFKNIKYI